APATATVPTLGDAGFEASPVAAGQFTYSAPGSAWTFGGSPGSGSGLSANGSAFTRGNPDAPQGSQVAFLQGRGSFSQAVAGWAAGSYRLSFLAARRAIYSGTQDF